jgi:beta-lactamase superfamily II metal-dependent hydrolase
VEFGLRVLKAEHGDCFLISGDFDGQPRNILIDGGPSKTYEYGIFPGDLKKLLLDIEQKGEVVDLLILTHIDDDHIDGLLRGFKGDGLLLKLTQKVWFNSGKLIFEHFNKKVDKSNLVNLQGSNAITGEDSFSSVSQGVTFEDVIEKQGIWDRRLIIAPDVITEFGIKFTILSPTEDKLSKLLTVWKRKSPESLTSKNKSDYDIKFDDILKNDRFEEDQSKSNGSSIAFILEYNNKKLLMLGDAHNKTIVNSLIDLQISENNPLKCEYVKISHHGSKKNTNYDLLNLVDCTNYIFSSNSKIHYLPNKTTIARIAKLKPNATLFFNYPSIIEESIFKGDIESLKTLKANGLKIVSCEELITI